MSTNNNDNSVMDVISNINDLHITLHLPEPCCSRTIMGWSDIPCQGEQLMLEMEIESTISFPSSRTSIQQQDDNKIEINNNRPLCHSPTSSIVQDLDLLADGETAVKEMNSTTSTKNERRVSFSPIIQVQTYDLVLGDHPCCVGGMALQCGWNHTEPELIDLDIHEETSSPKRRMQQLHMGYSVRRKRLETVSGLTGSQLLQLEYNLRCMNQVQNNKPMKVSGRIIHHTSSFQQLAAALTGSK